MRSGATTVREHLVAGELVDDIDVQLQAKGSPDRAEHERAYLKTDLTHYGTSVPAVRSVARGVLSAHPQLTRDDLVRLVHGLWDRRVHEPRMAAVELLVARERLLVPEHLPLVERLVRRARTWALVDPLAMSVAGPLTERHPELTEVLDRWAGDDDFWVRRSALLALLVPLRRGDGDFERFARYADAMLDEKEFFIRKAVGWVLRDTARKRPDLVHAWLLPRAHRMSGVTLREAVKPLSDDQRGQIVAARTGRRE